MPRLSERVLLSKLRITVANGEDGALACQQVKFQAPGTDYILWSCWIKYSHGNAQVSQAVGKAMGCFLQTGCKALLLMMIFMLLNVKK